MTGPTERIETVIVGGGQAGLAVGYHLQRRGLSFVVLEARERIGDVWRERWDSLRLFTPARYDGLPGLPFPAPPNSFPTKDDMADYLEAYARHHALPVRTGTRVERLSRDGDTFVVEGGDRRIEARQVVVAMANYQRPRVPEYAAELARDIVQVHSGAYRNPGGLPDGDVLVVGAANSGAEIALELARGRSVSLAGTSPGEIPFDIDGPAGRAFLVRLVLRGIFHRVLTVATPIGRKARPKMLRKAAMRVRTKEAHLAAAGVERLPRVAGVRDGRPLLVDGRVVDAAAVVWCTGFHPGFEWIDLGIAFDAHGPVHDRGAVAEAPGLFFVGLHFLYAQSSSMIHGVGRDAERIARLVATRSEVEGGAPARRRSRAEAGSLAPSAAEAPTSMHR